MTKNMVNFIVWMKFQASLAEERIKKWGGDSSNGATVNTEEN